MSYVFAVGRRKEAVARVRWHASQPAGVTVNGLPLATYFPTFELQHIVLQPLVLTHHDTHGAVSAKVSGGGINGQAESVRLGIARALVKVDADLRLVLKRAGFLRRDPRVKERKKYGLKRARRAPQWQKR
ncbi:MAG: 30S ribosomal protein S9 [Patescibacteria group bacterium]